MKRLHAAASICLAIVALGVAGCSSNVHPRSASCATYDGPNPTAAEFRSTWADRVRDEATLRQKFGVPSAPGAEDIEHPLMNMALEALSRVPSGGVSAYTNHLCGDIPVTPGSPWEKKTNEVLGALAKDSDKLVDDAKRLPGWEHADLAGWVTANKELDKKYPLHRRSLPARSMRDGSE